MYPKKPGLDETEEMRADPSVDESLQPNDTEAANTVDETSATDVPENEALAETEAPEEMMPAAEAAEPATAESVEAEAPADEMPAPVVEAEAPADEPPADEMPASVVEAEAPADEPPADETPASVVEGETPAPAEVTSEPVAETAAEAEGASTLKAGDLVEGTITSTSPTLVTVDVGGPRDGIIPGHELERMNRQMLESLKQGAAIKAYVVNPRNHNGDIVLSVNRALEEIDWQRAEEHRQSQETYDTRIAGYNKGGLIVRFGRLRGFVPQSQMSIERRRALTETQTPEERWGAMVNEPIVVKVMEVDRERNRLILSERFASRQSREKRKENLIKELTLGEVRDGRVVSLEDFGAFIDVGGAEGLVHLTEMSWQHITHPREMLQVGETVRVEVISIDKDNKRIGLSMKRQAPDPWDTIAINYTVGQLVQGMVTKLTKFGAFAQLVDVPEIEGLIHISELSDKRVTHPREVVNEGDTLTLRVVKIDIKSRRLGLSLKKVNSAEYLDLDWSTSPDEGVSADTSEAPEAITVEASSVEPSDTTEELDTDSVEPTAISDEMEAIDVEASEETAPSEPTDGETDGEESSTTQA